MAPRAYWKGHVRLALVSFPVRLYAAVTSTSRVKLHRIHRESGERVRVENVVPEEGPVDDEDIVLGYEYERGHYVPIEPGELEALDIESRHTIDLTRFVDLDEIDPVWFDRPYFLAPDGEIAAEAFVTIRDALRRTKKVALGTIVLGRRERVVAIQRCGEGLLLETLRWPDEVRESERYFDDIGDVGVSADQVEMAEALIEKRSGPFEPETFADRYQEKLRELIEEKLRTGTVRKPRRKGTPRRDNVVDLTAALKQSLSESRKSGTERGAGSRETKGGKSKTSAGRSKQSGRSSGGSNSAASGAKKSGTSGRRKRKSA